MRKRLTLLFAIAVLGVGASAGNAFADNPVRVAQEETDDGGDDDGSDYGWIGLLGLAGLAGLLGRGRRRDYDDRDRVRTTTPGGTTGSGTTGGTTTRP